MLTITIPATEGWDDEKERFVDASPEVQLQLEHSLISLQLWESKWEKPFLGENEKSTEEVLDYIRCMCMTPEIPPEVFSNLSESNLELVQGYIQSSMTATWFNEAKKPKKSTETITAELIYYWMLTLDIPFTCETWHLNRLFTLIKVCDIKNAKPTKMSRKEQAANQSDLNARRKAQLGTNG